MRCSMVPAMCFDSYFLAEETRSFHDAPHPREFILFAPAPLTAPKSLHAAAAGVVPPARFTGFSAAESLSIADSPSPVSQPAPPFATRRAFPRHERRCPGVMAAPDCRCTKESLEAGAWPRSATSTMLSHGKASLPRKGASVV